MFTDQPWSSHALRITGAHLCHQPRMTPADTPSTESDARSARSRSIHVWCRSPPRPRAVELATRARSRIVAVLCNSGECSGRAEHGHGGDILGDIVGGQHQRQKMADFATALRTIRLRFMQNPPFVDVDAVVRQMFTDQAWTSHALRITGALVIASLLNLEVCTCRHRAHRAILGVRDLARYVHDSRPP